MFEAIFAAKISVSAKTALSWNIQAGVACPGKTAACSAVCYANKNRLAPNMDGGRVAAANLAVLKACGDNVPALKAVLDSLKWGRVKARRLHGAGDIYSLAYFEAIVQHVAANPGKVYWTYTRSFAILLQAKAKGIQIPANLRLLLSADKDNVKQAQAMGRMLNLPVAYMGDAAPQGAVTCPAIAKPKAFPLSRKADDTPCQRCGICFNDKPRTHLLAKGLQFPIH